MLIIIPSLLVVAGMVLAGRVVYKNTQGNFELDNAISNTEFGPAFMKSIGVFFFEIKTYGFKFIY